MARRKLRYFIFGVYYSKRTTGILVNYSHHHDLTHYISRRFPTKKDLTEYYRLRDLDIQGCIVTSLMELKRREFRIFTGLDPDKCIEVKGKEKLEL